jgi:hypothetical protein
MSQADLDNQRKIFFAAANFPSIFRAYRTGAWEFIARPGRVFCRPEYDLLAALCFKILDDAHD